MGVSSALSQVGASGNMAVSWPTIVHQLTLPYPGAEFLHSRLQSTGLVESCIMQAPRRVPTRSVYATTIVSKSPMPHRRTLGEVRPPWRGVLEEGRTWGISSPEVLSQRGRRASGSKAGAQTWKSMLAAHGVRKHSSYSAPTTLLS